MVGQTRSTMSKNIIRIVLLFCAISIPLGKSDHQCPKNPLISSNSVSGMIVGTIVATEKITSGIGKYFYFLTENTLNQIISVTNTADEFITKYSIQIHGFALKLVGGTYNQVKMIYATSTGPLKSTLDLIIRMENSIQSKVSEKLTSISDGVISGKYSKEIFDAINNPIQAVKSDINSVVIWLKTNFKSLQGGLNGFIEKLKNGDFSLQMSGIIGAPVNALKDFFHSASLIFTSVGQDASNRFSGFIRVLKHGSITEILSSLIASPVGVVQPFWLLTVQLTGASKKSIESGFRNTFQPILGKDLTHVLGKTMSLPVDLFEIIWNSYLNLFNEFKDFTASITGGGSLSTQINTVITNPIPSLKNTVQTSVSSIKGFTKGLIGQDITNHLIRMFSMPFNILSGFLSPILGQGGLSVQIKTFLASPINISKNIWIQIKTAIRGVTKGIFGAHLTDELGELVSSPATILNKFLSPFIGGGSLSFKLVTTLTNPLSEINTIWMRCKGIIAGYADSITGGGSFLQQIESTLSHPLDTLKNTWSATTSTIAEITAVIVGKNFTQTVSHAITSPLSTLKHITASITGGGSLGDQLKAVIFSPVTVTLNTYTTLKQITKGVSNMILGKTITGDLSYVLGFPTAELNKIFMSITGSGKLITLLKTLATSPLKSTEHALSESVGILKGSVKFILGKQLTDQLGQVLKSPLSSTSGLLNSLVSSIKGIFSGSVHISGSISAGGNAGGGSAGGGITSGVTSLIKAPGRLVTKSLDGLSKLWKSFAGAVGGLASHIPIIGVKAKVKIGGGGGTGGGGSYHSSFSVHGGGGGNAFAYHSAVSSGGNA